MGDVSEEKAKSFHQDIEVKEKLYQGLLERPYDRGLLLREIEHRIYKRKSYSTSFTEKKKRKYKPILTTNNV